MTRARWTTVAAATVALLVVVLDRRTIVGPLLVLGFMAVAPGSALSRLLRFPTRGASGWVVTIGASFSIDVLVTEEMIYAHVWTPARGLIVLCLLTFALVGAECVMPARRVARDARDTRNS